MERQEKLRRAKELLEMVLKDRASVTRALDDWPEEAGIDGKLFDTARWQLVYIHNDEDIIHREPEYGERMLKILGSLCDELRKRIEMGEGDREKGVAPDDEQ